MANSTHFRTRQFGSTSTAVRLNAAAMLVAIGAIIWQIAAGVDYPDVPPGPIILGAAVVIVLTLQATWARIVGIFVPLFLIVGGTIASVANDDHALRNPGDTSAFLATVLQMAAVLFAVLAGVAAFRERRAR